MTDVHYVRNELGAVHSVDAEHFLEYLHTTTRGGHARLKPEFEEIDEATARAENPQLFGRPDADIVHSMTAAEIKEMRERRAFEAELAAEYAAEQEPEAEPELEAPKSGRK